MPPSVPAPLPPELLSRGETNRLECKSAKGGFPKSFWESYSAFANMDGGTIVLGVSEPRKGTFVVEGVERPAVLVKTLWDTVNNPEKVSANVLFDRHVRIGTLEGRTVVAVDVPRADRVDRPVYVGRDVFRGTFRRNGEGDYRCPRESGRAMLRDQGADTADGTIVEHLAVSDLDADTIRRYRNRFARFKEGHVWNDLPDDEFLLKIGAARRDPHGNVRPTRAGLLCFGDFQNILDEFPNFFLDYRERLSDDNRWSDRVCSSDGTWSGNVYDFFFRIHDRLTADIRVPFAMSDAVSRIDDTDAHKAVREALANALVHADWFGRQGVVVEKSFRRISIANPGCLRIRKEVAIAGGTSDARNSRLFNIFALVDIGERSGSGLCNLYAVWRKSGQPIPSLHEAFDPDRTVLTIDFERKTSHPQARAVSDPTITPSVTPSVTPPVTPPVAPPVAPLVPEGSLNRLLQVLASGAKSASQIREALSLSDRNHARDAYIDPALSSGLIERTIPDKPNSRLQKYRLTAKGRAAILSRTSKA